MKEKIKKTLIYLVFPFTFIIMIINSVFSVFQKEKTKKESENPAYIKESPHVTETRYSDPFQGRNLVIRSINASASIVNAFDDFFK